MLDIYDLLVTQSGIRDHNLVLELSEYIDQGGIFNGGYCDVSQTKVAHHPIQIDRMPDLSLYIRDGHHRVAGMHLSKRRFLYPEEYILKDKDYDMFMAINFDVGWVTPFNLKTEIRIPDFVAFKKKVLTMPRDEATDYIRSHKHEYAMPRRGVDHIHTMLKFCGVI